MVPRSAQKLRLIKIFICPNSKDHAIIPQNQKRYHHTNQTNTLNKATSCNKCKQVKQHELQKLEDVLGGQGDRGTHWYTHFDFGTHRDIPECQTPVTFETFDQALIFRGMRKHDLTNKKTMTMTKAKTMTMTNTLREHLQRVIFDTFDLVSTHHSLHWYPLPMFSASEMKTCHEKCISCFEIFLVGSELLMVSPVSSGLASPPSSTFPKTTLARLLHLSLRGLADPLFDKLPPDPRCCWGAAECLRPPRLLAIPPFLLSLLFASPSVLVRPNTVFVEYRRMDWKKEEEWRLVKKSAAELALLCPPPPPPPSILLL